MLIREGFVLSALTGGSELDDSVWFSVEMALVLATMPRRGVEA